MLGGGVDCPPLTALTVLPLSDAHPLLLRLLRAHPGAPSLTVLCGWSEGAHSDLLSEAQLARLADADGEKPVVLKPLF